MVAHCNAASSMLKLKLVTLSAPAMSTPTTTEDNLKEMTDMWDDIGKGTFQKPRPSSTTTFTNGIRGVFHSP